MEGCAVEEDEAKLGVTVDLIMMDEVHKLNSVEDDTGLVESEVVETLIEEVSPDMRFPAMWHMTSVNSYEPVQPPLKLIHSK